MEKHPYCHPSQRLLPITAMHPFLTVFLLLITLAASAQNKSQPDYTRDWKRADSLAAKGLPKSALEIANRIYKEAKARKNYPQLAKAVISRLTFRNSSDEEAYKELVQSLRSDIDETPQLAKSILQSVLGDLYWQYFQQNRYKFYNRSTVNTETNQTSQTVSSDFTTWDAHQLIDAITTAYKSSVRSKELLQKTPIADYDVLLDTGDPEARLLRPTLYDLLAHRAIAFFQNTEPNLLKPIFKFELDQPSYLTTPDVFTKLNLQSQDSLSGQYQALQLYQQLVIFHLADQNPNALADADGLRLAFVHQHSVAPGRDSLYRKTLEAQAAHYKNELAEAVYAYQLAEFLTKRNGPVQPLDDMGEPVSEPEKPNASRWNTKQAADICRDLIKRFPKTLPGRQAAQLLNQLLLPTYSVQVEQVNIPQQPFRALVSYQNVSRIRYRIIPVSTTDLQTYRDGYGNDDRKKKQLSVWLKKNYAAENAVGLPDDGDLNRHSVEVPFTGLPIGHYLLLTTTDDTFGEKSESVQYTSFTVSALGYLVLPPNSAEKNQTVLITNRLTGEPLQNVRVSLIGAASPIMPKALQLGQTDADGRVLIPTGNLPTQSNFQYLITSQTDTLLSEQQYYYRFTNEQPQAQTYVRLFTDRAIYRPGQPIYVKGLLYAGKTNQFAVQANQDVTVGLHDENGEQVTTQTVKTNEFGTFTTSFSAPTGRLTGVMNLQTPYGSTEIRVEEYKRPTFEVKTKPIRQSYKLDQTITLSASASTYSGAVIDGADVRYRIVRKLRPRWERWYMPGRANQTEIANGVAKTDAQGNVTITFKALPDREQARETNPVFDFEVSIDVTDQAGETRSATQTLRIGYSALQVDLIIPDQVEKDQPTTFPVHITNQSGANVAAKAQLTVYRLQPLTRPLRSRLWGRPDRQLLSRTEFEKLFPNDLYANENDPRTWPKGNIVQQQTINAPADSLIRPDLSRYTPGDYVAELTVTDSTGEVAKERAFFAVVSDKEPVASPRPDAWVQVRKAIGEPGEEAIFWVGNSQPGWVMMTVEEREKLVRQEWIKTDGKPRRVTLPISEQQRGGFAVHFAMIQNGRLYQKSQTIAVPFTNKELHIETQTFRTKLKPGEREEWTLTVSGLEKKTAELVATLYDASLDSFTKLDWPTSIYQPYAPMFYGWHSGSFGIQSGNILLYRYRPEPPVPTRRYDQLMGTGNGQMIRIRGKNTGLERAVAAGAAPMSMAKVPGPASMNKAEKVVELAEVIASEPDKKSIAQSIPSPVINPRRNFNETAFFLPQLKTDEQGRVVLKFTMPEALTRWRLLTFAHTKELKTGTLERDIVTQKELMITANAPRFLREGDTIQVKARLTNLSDRPISNATTNLFLTNALTGEPLTAPERTTGKDIAMLAPGLSTSVGWTVIVPKGVETVLCRLTAQAGLFTDGEEFTVPVLPNRMLVTDSQPFWVNGRETKEFKLKPLTNLNPELPVQHERLTVEVTSNPNWYALQSLPYLMEYRYECAEQLFSRLYANSLAAHIINSKPAFRQVITEWQKNRTAGPSSKSPLETNAELKAVALENSPWLADARSEADRQAKLAQLLDANRLESEQRQAIAKLQQLQTEAGGFQWFGGMEPNLSITLHILSGFGHLQKLGVRFPDDLQGQISDMEIKAIRHADAELKRWFEEQKKLDEQKKKAVGSWYFSTVQYLYARSFYPNQPIEKPVLTYLKQRVVNEWTKQSLQGQALSALAMHRFGDDKTANGILASLRERSRKSEELGMYWPDNQSGLFWYQAPIETQAYLIEAFDEINPVQTEVDDMRRWLVRQKQTQSWSSTKATTEAVYALLLRGSNWMGTGVTTQVSVGGQPIENRVTKSDAVTGYEKVTYAAAEIKPEMGAIQITKQADGPAWGALYWQHFEPLDRVMPGSAGLSVQKTLYVQHDSPTGPVITTINTKTALKPGDLIKVRLLLKTDRVMEYVHLKDSRASGFEPVAALSGYKYQNGLGYYESPRDASTDFFLSYLPVGTHVFEYDLRVAQTGDFSAGVATVQCFYAPEFAAHSTGERVKVK